MSHELYGGGWSNVLDREVMHRKEIAAVNKAGVSILLVEQNIKTALKLCSRIYLMEKGAIVHEAATDELQEDKETLHRYLGVSV